MRSRFRSFIAATAVAAAAVTGGVVAAAPAGAAPPSKPLPVFTLTGDNFGMFGDHDFCRGTVNVRLTTPKRAVVRVTFTSNGFTGNGPGWVRNPRCRVLLAFTHTSALTLYKQTFVPASFGTKPGEKITRDIVTGSGLVSIGATAYATNTPVQVPLAYGAGFYAIVP